MPIWEVTKSLIIRTFFLCKLEFTCVAKWCPYRVSLLSHSFFHTQHYSQSHVIRVQRPYSISTRYLGIQKSLLVYKLCGWLGSRFRWGVGRVLSWYKSCSLWYNCNIMIQVWYCSLEDRFNNIDIDDKKKLTLGDGWLQMRVELLDGTRIW